MVKFRLIPYSFLALLLGGGVSYASQNALPGDILYSVKRYVNENAEATLALTDKGKAGFEIESASRRLGEIEKLAEKNKLTVSVLGDIRSRFDKNVIAFREINRNIKETDRTGASSLYAYMESSLDAHNELLKRIEKKAAYEKKLSELAEDVAVKKKEISEERRLSEENSSAKNGAEEKSSMEEALKTAENKIRDVRKFIETEKKRNTGDMTPAEEKLKEAIAHVAEGKAKLDIPEYADALALFNRAGRESMSAKTLASFAVQ